MFNIFKRKNTATYTVEKLHDGRFGIVKREGANALLLNDYSRKRDALRGANRMGLELTD